MTLFVNWDTILGTILKHCVDGFTVKCNKKGGHESFVLPSVDRFLLFDVQNVRQLVETETTERSNIFSPC